MDASAVKLWRRTERERLLAERLAVDVAERQRRTERLGANLDGTLGDIAGRIVSVYWPLRGEPDLRPWMGRVIARGGHVALPVVTIRNAPLIFRPWTPDTRMERGFWNIPVPAEDAETIPDIVLAPVVGFDPACYRLGYGGGYFDRTLAAFPKAPRVIGVGYAQAAIPTIHPQPHDIAMSAIVTEDAIFSPR